MTQNLNKIEELAEKIEKDFEQFVPKPVEKVKKKYIKLKKKFVMKFGLNRNIKSKTYSNY